jgi:hypothetical protein
MRTHPVLELLESRHLLTGGPAVDPVNHPETQQLLSAYAIVNASQIPVTTYAAPNIAAQSATTSATHFMSAFESSAMSPAPTGPPTVSMHGALLMTPRIYGGSGIVTPQAPPEVHTSDEGAEQDAKGAGKPTSMSPPTDNKASDATAPRKRDELEATGRTVLPETATRSSWAVLDSCFADEAWALQFEDAFAGGSAEVGRPSDLEMFGAMAGLAAMVQFTHADAREHSDSQGPKWRRVSRHHEQTE